MAKENMPALCRSAKTAMAAICKKKKDVALMTEKTISALVEGGKATAGPPIGPALGPLGINTGKVVAEINEKTKEFAGVTVPVKIIIDTAKKSYIIEIGTPSTAALIKKELLLEKGSQKAGQEIVADISIDQLIKVSRSKAASLLSKTPENALKEVIGTCITLGILIDGKSPKDILKEVDAGNFKDKISGKVALRAVSKEEIEKKKGELAKIIEAKRKAEEAAKVAAEAAKAAATAAKAPAEGEAKKEEGKKEGGKKEDTGKEEAKAPAKKEEKKK